MGIDDGLEDAAGPIAEVALYLAREVCWDLERAPTSAWLGVLSGFVLLLVTSSLTPMMNLEPIIVCSVTWLSSSTMRISSRPPRMNTPGCSRWFSVVKAVSSHACHQAQETARTGGRDENPESVDRITA